MTERYNHLILMLLIMLFPNQIEDLRVSWIAYHYRRYGERFPAEDPQISAVFLMVENGNAGELSVVVYFFPGF